jgi:aldehyde:ferredoxin oxidoreductase
MNGYAGTILEVDLTRQKCRPRRIDGRLLRDYLGGRGLAVRLVWDSLGTAHTKPLDPENPIVFATGPLTGFPVHGASRTSVVTKSPATSPRSGLPGAATLAIGQMPGHFAAELKYAGYDALVIKGRAKEPISLIVRDDKVEFRPARVLWGKEIPEAEHALRAELPLEPFQIVAIGPAGERQVPLATVVHSHPYASHAGRGGIGAVMGAKNLKAIAVRGTLQPFDAADPTGFDELSRKATQNLEKWVRYETWRRYGTACLVEAGSDAGILAVRNFREGTCAAASKVGAVRAEALVWVRSEACYYCPLHCRKVGLVRRSDGSGLAVAGPELETSAMLGTNCGLHDIEAVLTVKDRCDRLGLDPSSTGNVLGFLMETAETGRILPSFLDGIDLVWGDAEAMVALTDRIGRAQGAGADVGRGVRAVAARIGGGSEAWAMEVKGLEMDTYNVPALPAMVTVYGTNAVGAAHEMGHSPEVQNQRAVSDSLGLCRFHTYSNPLEFQAELLAAVTGFRRSPDELLAAGERIWSLERAFASREGFGPADDLLPPRPKTDAFTFGQRAGALLSTATETAILSDYYTVRGWDPKTAAPLPETLRRLGMEDVAASMKAS